MIPLPRALTVTAILLAGALRLSAQEETGDLAARIALAENRFGIRIRVNRRPAMTDAQQRATLLTVLEELDVYPVSAIRKGGLNRINIGVIPHLGLTSYRPPTINIRPPTDPGHPGQIAWLRWVIHHELMHVFDHAMGNPREPWDRVNAPDFRYGSPAPRPGPSGPTPFVFPGLPAAFSDLAPPDHFTRRYALTNMQEDKAETHALLMTGYDLLHGDRIPASPRILDAKARLIKEQLRRFDPGFNDDFWRRARDHSDDVPETLRTRETATSPWPHLMYGFSTTDPSMRTPRSPARALIDIARLNLPLTPVERQLVNFLKLDRSTEIEVLPSRPEESEGFLQRVGEMNRILNE